MTIKFKHGCVYQDFFKLHPRVIEIYGFIVFYCNIHYEITPSITSMLRPKADDSGVHETGRALDFSEFEYNSGGIDIVKTMTKKAIKDLLSIVNDLFPREDGKETLIYHDVGRGKHFHLQVEYHQSWYNNERVNIALSKERRAS